jgi:hypothetical protein
MAHLREHGVEETCTTAGTGNFTVAGAVTARRAFSSIAGIIVGDTFYYRREAVDANGNPSGAWEWGLGTWQGSNVIARTSVLLSTNANAAVDFGTGTTRVFIAESPSTLVANLSDQLLLSGDLTPAQITANQNDYNPAGLANATVLRLNLDATRRITGIAGGADGRVLIILNVSAAVDADLIMTYEDTASVAANRIANDTDTVLEPLSAAILIYDDTSSRWRIAAVKRKYTGTTFRHTPFYATDFLGAAGADTGEASYAVWDLAVIATGTQAKQASEPNHPGILRVTSSTTTNSGAVIRTDASAVRLAGGEIAEFVFRPVDLTTATIRLGFIDTATSADVTDGAYLEMAATGVIIGRTANNSTRSSTATLATLVANTWYRGRIVVNRAATAVDFYVFDDNGNLLGSAQLTANIPTAAGRETGHGIIGTKSGTVAQAIFDIDYQSIEFARALV